MKLPVHGFVLAGGKSSRMGADKALLPFCGRPMVEIAVEKLRKFCGNVSLAGNRDDLRQFAPVAPETRMDAGPAAGIEAGLMAAAQPWAMFVPVDAPLLPPELLRAWAAECLVREADGLRASYLQLNGRSHPAMCFLRRDCLPAITHRLDLGERRLEAVLAGVDEMGRNALQEFDATRFPLEPGSTAPDFERWFANVNTPQELAEAEAWVCGIERKHPTVKY